MKKKKSDNELLKRVLGIVGNVFDSALQILLIVAIVYIVYRGAGVAYDYGYRIFTEKPMAASVGREVEVSIPVDFNGLDLGKLFEEKGLTRDSKLLALQYYCSEFREDVKGGTYTLSTTMTAEEMFESIAEINIEKDRLKKEAEEALKAEEEAARKAEEAKEDGDTPGTEETPEADGEKSGEDEGVQQIDMGDDPDSFLEDDVR
ncbi:MAG: hypothetical protein IJ796_11475 [Lachnospiraceae bacterium]|nr:hypothetical protein [Lachnospiraceae bacterium]